MSMYTDLLNTGTPGRVAIHPNPEIAVAFAGFIADGVIYCRDHILSNNRDDVLLFEILEEMMSPAGTIRPFETEPGEDFARCYVSMVIYRNGQINPMQLDNDPIPILKFGIQSIADIARRVLVAIAVRHYRSRLIEYRQEFASDYIAIEKMVRSTVATALSYLELKQEERVGISKRLLENSIERGEKAVAQMSALSAIADGPDRFIDEVRIHPRRSSMLEPDEESIQAEDAMVQREGERKSKAFALQNQIRPMLNGKKVGPAPTMPRRLKQDAISAAIEAVGLDPKEVYATEPQISESELIEKSIQDHSVDPEYDPDLELMYSRTKNEKESTHMYNNYQPQMQAQMGPDLRQVMDGNNNPLFMADGRTPFVLPVEQLPRMPVFVMANEGNNAPMFDQQGAPVLITNYSMDPRLENWDYWSPQAESQFLQQMNNYGGYQPDQRVQNVHTGFQPKDQPNQSTQGYSYGYGAEDEDDDDLPYAGLAQAAFDSEVDRPIERPPLAPQPEVQETKTPTQMSLELASAIFGKPAAPLKDQDQNIYYVIEVNGGTLRASENRQINCLGDLEKEYAHLVGLPQDMSLGVNEFLITKEYWMYREDHLGQYDYLELGSDGEGDYADLVSIDRNPEPEGRDRDELSFYKVDIDDSISQNTESAEQICHVAKVMNPEDADSKVVVEVKHKQILPGHQIPQDLLVTFNLAVEQSKEEETQMTVFKAFNNLLTALAEKNEESFMPINLILSQCAGYVIQYLLDEPYKDMVMAKDEYFTARTDILNFLASKNQMEEYIEKMNRLLFPFSDLVNMEAEFALAEPDEEGMLDDIDQEVDQLADRPSYAFTALFQNMYVTKSDTMESHMLGRLTLKTNRDMYIAAESTFQALKGTGIDTIYVATELGEVYLVMREREGACSRLFVIDKL